MGFGFVPECNHAQEIHTSHVSFVRCFCLSLQDHGLLKNFAITATRCRNDFSVQ